MGDQLANSKRLVPEHSSLRRVLALRRTCLQHRGRQVPLLPTRSIHQDLPETDLRARGNNRRRRALASFRQAERDDAARCL